MVYIERLNLIACDSYLCCRVGILTSKRPCFPIRKSRRHAYLRIQRLDGCKTSDPPAMGNTPEQLNFDLLDIDRVNTAAG